jgi:perosamine synthetase
MVSSSERLVCPRGGTPAAAAIAHSAPTIHAPDIAAVVEQLESGWIATGDTSLRFGDALRAHAGAAHATPTASGTGGLTLALHALGVGSGDEVIVPTYVCRSVLEAVRMAGATAVLCDVGDDWMMHPDAVERVRSARTRALIAVSIFGLACDHEALARCGLPIIDDRCQAFGLPRPASALVRYSVCSFHATKCLTTGEGGAVLAWSAADAARLDAVAIAHRRTLGVFSDLQAALGLAQLAAWPVRQERRTALAMRYLHTLPHAHTARLRAAAVRGSVWFRLPVTLPHDLRVDKAQARFAEYGVHVRRGVDALLHRTADLPDHAFPGAVSAFDRTLSLPIWPDLSDAQQAHVLEVCAHVLV